MGDFNDEAGAVDASASNYAPPEQEEQQEQFNSTASAAADPPPPSSYAELEEMPTDLPSSSALDAFLAEWETKLEAKRRVEEAKKLEVVAKARAELEKFAAEREGMRERKQSNNRKEEQVKLEKLEADLEAENPWERVINLVDMQADTPSKADMTRFKQLCIQLKNEPISKDDGAGRKGDA